MYFCQSKNINVSTNIILTCPGIVSSLSRTYPLSQEVELDESVNRNPLQRKNVIQLTNCLEMFTSKEQLGRQDPWSVALVLLEIMTESIDLTKIIKLIPTMRGSTEVDAVIMFPSMGRCYS